MDRHNEGTGLHGGIRRLVTLDRHAVLVHNTNTAKHNKELIMSQMRALRIAEQIIHHFGDPFWFKEQYTLARNFNNIPDSIEIALKAQDNKKLLRLYKDMMNIV